jgi:hypothetical protein
MSIPNVNSERRNAQRKGFSKWLLFLLMVLALASIGWNYSSSSQLLAVSHCYNDPQQQQLLDTPNVLLQLQPPQTSPTTTTTTMYSKFTQSTAIITISFGKNATRTQLVERWVWSLRGNGDWQGNIFVLTDDATHYETVFSSNSSSDKKVHVLKAKEEDLYPVDPNTQPRLVWAKEAMRRKRFKTLVLEYLEDYFYTSQHTDHNNDIQPQQHVLYMDMEIVVARPISGLLLDYQDQMIRRDIGFLETNGNGMGSQTVNDTTTTTTANIANNAFMSMFTDCPTCARRNTNSGVMMLHTQNSKPCLKLWRRLFDDRSTWAVYDQRHLRDLHASTACTIYTLPDHHRLYPNRKEMRTFQSATIVHITNTYGSLTTPEHVQRAYFEYLLTTNRFSAIERF